MRTNKIGWLEFNWKTTIGKWICSKKGHIKGKFGRCKRCVKLVDESLYPPTKVNCRSSWEIFIDEEIERINNEN